MPQVAQGGTVRLTASFEDAAGQLVDPVTPLVDVINPSNVVVVNDAVPVRDSLGEYHYDFTAAIDAPLGAWTARWSGVISGGTVTGDENFTVLEPGSIGLGAPWLVQLADARVALGITNSSDTRKDSQIITAITAASVAIRNFTERQFGSPLVTETREFDYDNSGYLDIDDAAAVTGIQVVVPHGDNLVIDADMWRALPHRRVDAPVYTYVKIPTRVGQFSPAMGFTRNLDTYVTDHGLSDLPDLVQVTGTWGWPEVPADVKQAAYWTIRDWVNSPKASEALSSESIAGYARSWSRGFGGMGMLAIPNDARDLLVAYQRQKV